MAERRMFAKSIVLSDAFLDMPLSARCLYFTFGMFADDDGFVNSPKGIMRQCGASVDDFNVLLAKKFILLFENGVIVIKHWRINNYLRNDRFTPTKYVDEKDLLRIEENGSYTLNDYVVYPKAVYPDKYSIDKVSIDKDSIKHTCVENTQVSASGSSKNNYSANFEEFWKCYPRRKEKAKAYKCYQTRLKDGFTEEELLRACKAYADECKKKHTEEQYIKLCATFIGPNTPFVDYLKGGDTDGRDSDTNSGKTQTGEGIYDDFAKEYLAKRGITV